MVQALQVIHVGLLPGHQQLLCHHIEVDLPFGHGLKALPISRDGTKGPEKAPPHAIGFRRRIQRVTIIV